MARPLCFSWACYILPHSSFHSDFGQGSSHAFLSFDHHFAFVEQHLHDFCLRNLSHTPWVVAAFASWGIALLEYLLQVPANRIGHQVMNVGQLKILQECIALSSSSPSPSCT